MSQLTTNTTTINECIALANTLPDAGSGGSGASVETSNVTIAASTFPSGACYSPTLGEVVMWSPDEPGSSAQFECVKGTIIIVDVNEIHTCTFVGCRRIRGNIVLITDSVARIE